MLRTKIICTLGPATDDPNVLSELILNGLNVARLNFSHGSHEEHYARVQMVKEIRKKYNLPVALMLDTRGPEIRVKKFASGQVELVKDQKFTLTTGDILGDNSKVSITYDGLYSDVMPGTKILFDDGLIEMQVETICGTDVICKVSNSGILKDNKSVNVPGIHLKLPYLSKQDCDDVLFAIENDFDFIAASFVSSRDDVLQMRRFLEKNNGGDIQIISKIENAEGVKNAEQILKVTDGVMIARGDMGVEIPFEEIPKLQKMLIRQGRSAGKYVVTATQMLDSMIRNPRPTRAETTDVANAIYDGTNAIMLSGETAAGKYPVESLKTMIRIAQVAESDISYIKRSRYFDAGVSTNVTNAISHATCTTANDLGAAAIITATKSGHTARMVSKFRPACPIIAATLNEKVWRQLALVWGVYPYMIEETNTTDELFDASIEAAMRSGIVHSGDLVVISAGVPVGISGTTNIIKVHIVGNILVRGERVNQMSACGILNVCKNEQEALKSFEDGQILVIPSTSNEILHLLKRARGIITEERGLTSHAAIVGMSLDIPVVCGAQGATNMLITGTAVTIDSSSGLVFRGALSDTL